MANKDKGRLDKVLEGFKPIPMKRMFYPRGMKLSEDFINAFHREYDRLVSEGINPKTLVERVGKAMKFHVNDTRKYKLLDEKKAKSAAEEENKKRNLPAWLSKEKEIRDDVEDIEEDPHEGDRGEKHGKRQGKSPTSKDKPKASKAHKRKHK